MRDGSAFKRKWGRSLFRVAIVVDGWWMRACVLAIPFPTVCTQIVLGSRPLGDVAACLVRV